MPGDFADDAGGRARARPSPCSGRFSNSLWHNALRQKPRLWSGICLTVILLWQRTHRIDRCAAPNHSRAHLATVARCVPEDLVDELRSRCHSVPENDTNLRDFARARDGVPTRDACRNQIGEVVCGKKLGGCLVSSRWGSNYGPPPNSRGLQYPRQGSNL